ncbi:MAG: hypothetical protein GY940_13470 [bacterium]|nr:hypothetical protein [bacterium]
MIIGIHGLANKPSKDVLKDWWEKSILEGLKVNEKGYTPSNFKFKMVYWADLLYKNPQHMEEDFSFDSLYNAQPYFEAKEGALKEYETSLIDRARAGLFDVIGDAFDYLKRKNALGGVADWILRRVMKDLAFYYDENQQILNRSKKPELARKVLRDELKNEILPEKGKEIMLIAHSMGTIISYDVLRNLGHPDPKLEVPYFVTIGSPLGLPHVKSKIIKERGYDPKVRTPSIVTKSWINYADKDDPVAIDVHLRDDYGPNTSVEPGVRAVDDLVANDYVYPVEDRKVGKDGKEKIEIEDKGNPHKSYGYLRTPELSKHIRAFLESS